MTTWTVDFANDGQGYVVKYYITSKTRTDAIRQAKELYLGEWGKRDGTADGFPEMRVNKGTCP